MLFADISGFTPLSERLNKESGKQGCERLNALINKFFDQIINTGRASHAAASSACAAGPSLRQTELTRSGADLALQARGIIPSFTSCSRA